MWNVVERWLVRALAPAGLLLAALLPLGASAELYRWVDQDGRIFYGDRPPAGTAAVETRLDLRGEPAAPVVSAGVPAESPDTVRERNRARLAALESAHTEIREATAALRAAEERRERGVEPLPGERMGIVGPGSRLTEAYFERQRQLEREVAAARRRLESAHAGRNALR